MTSQGSFWCAGAKVMDCGHNVVTSGLGGARAIGSNFPCRARPSAKPLYMSPSSAPDRDPWRAPTKTAAKWQFFWGNIVKHGDFLVRNGGTMLIFRWPMKHGKHQHRDLTIHNYTIFFSALYVHCVSICCFIFCASLGQPHLNCSNISVFAAWNIPDCPNRSQEFHPRPAGFSSLARPWWRLRWPMSHWGWRWKEHESFTR